MDNFDSRELYEKRGYNLRLAALLSVPIGIVVWIVLGIQASSLTDQARLSRVGTDYRSGFVDAAADALDAQADTYYTMGLLAFLTSIGLCVLFVRMSSKVMADGELAAMREAQARAAADELRWRRT